MSRMELANTLLTSKVSLFHVGVPYRHRFPFRSHPSTRRQTARIFGHVSSLRHAQPQKRAVPEANSEIAVPYGEDYGCTVRV